MSRKLPAGCPGVAPSCNVGQEAGKLSSKIPHFGDAEHLMPYRVFARKDP